MTTLSGRYQAGRFSFAVRTNSPLLDSLIRETFRDLPIAQDPLVEVQILESDDGFVFARQANERTHYGPEGLHELIDDLSTYLNRESLDADHGRLHVHAGSVKRGDRGVVIAAMSGTGKTTLTLNLALRGWSYLSDEAFSVGVSEHDIHTFPKPLSIKRQGIALFDDVMRDRGVQPPPPPAASWYLPASSVGITTDTSMIPTLLVHYEHGNESDPAWQDINVPDSIVSLVGHTMDLERAGDSGLLALAGLCQRTSSVRVRRGDLEQTTDLIEELCHAAQPRPSVEPPRLLSSNTLKTQTLVVDGGAVLRNPSNGRVASLNPAALEIWKGVMNEENPTRSIDGDALMLWKQLDQAQLLSRPHRSHV